jgi:DNA invertase Pin-like site-specific DNA recombinase
MTSKRARRASIYARLSVTTEESVSIARQVDACQKYAAARGWEVVQVETDDGVSATRRRPQDRPGWGAILSGASAVDVVVVWKVDRLARRVLDFLNADAALQEHGAALVAVEDPIDLSTSQGRAFATMLAVFGEMEAAAIGSRVKAARAHLVRDGRAVGRRPWPYESVQNPDGPGLVWRPIPERAQACLDAVAALTAGTTSVAAVAREWADRFGSTLKPQAVQELLLSPTLAGATPSGSDVVRNADGTIRRDPSRVILTPASQKALARTIAANPRHRSASGPRPIRLPLLYRLATCASCGGFLTANRPTDPTRRHRYLCQTRACPAPVAIDLLDLEAFVVDRFLSEAASRPVAAWIDAPPSSDLDALTEALASVQEALVASEDDDDTARLLERRKTLRSAIRDSEALAPSTRLDVPGVSLLDLWESAGTTEEARSVLAGWLDRVEIRRTDSRRGSKVPDRADLVTKVT